MGSTDIYIHKQWSDTHAYTYLVVDGMIVTRTLLVETASTESPSIHHHARFQIRARSHGNRRLGHCLLSQHVQFLHNLPWRGIKPALKRSKGKMTHERRDATHGKDQPKRFLVQRGFKTPIIRTKELDHSTRDVDRDGNVRDHAHKPRGRTNKCPRHLKHNELEIAHENHQCKRHEAILHHGRTPDV